MHAASIFIRDASIYVWIKRTRIMKWISQFKHQTSNKFGSHIHGIHPASTRYGWSIQSTIKGIMKSIASNQMQLVLKKDYKKEGYLFPWYERDLSRNIKKNNQLTVGQEVDSAKGIRIQKLARNLKEKKKRDLFVKLLHQSVQLGTSLVWGFWDKVLMRRVTLIYLKSKFILVKLWCATVLCDSLWPSCI